MPVVLRRSSSPASLSTATVLGTRSTNFADTGTGTITDNDTATFTINDPTVDEAALAAALREGRKPSDD